MKKHKKTVVIVLCSLAMLILILDSGSALSSAQEGIRLCMQTIIPSLFPLLFISVKMNSELAGFPLQGLRLPGKLAGIPQGAESLLILGLLGGYPVGAQAIFQAYQAGTISHAAAKRLLGFCNNAGPAFIFGMLHFLFSDKAVVWILWLIHIISALLVGFFLPGKGQEKSVPSQSNFIILSNALERSIKSIAMICGWVILFRILYHFLDRWILFLLPDTGRLILAGILELANGCMMLETVANDGARFVLASVFLAFGGICVGMQTLSSVDELGSGLYFPGKLMQTMIAFILSLIAQYLIFPINRTLHLSVIVPIVVIMLLVTEIHMLKKYSSIPVKFDV